MDGFRTCTTNELTEQEKTGIRDLFRDCFHLEKTRKRFEQEFTKTCKGYSYHCIYRKDDRILASFCIIPYQYRVDGETLLFGLSVDTIVSPEAKLGPFGVADMAGLAEELAKNDGCSVLYGFPNDNFHAYNLEILGREEIGILDFYLVPLSPGKLKKSLTVFNFVRYSSLFNLMVLKMFSSSKELKYPIEKDDSGVFRGNRYDERHHFVRFPGGEAVYTLYGESFGTVAYLLDITPVSARNFYSAFLTVAKEVGKQAGLLVYPSGRLPFGGLLRIPRRLLPRKLHLVACGMGGRPLPASCRDMRNWKINLSDFDVR